MAPQAAYRPRRSVLYMPSSNERALEKAKTLPVDALILDLEDAVAPDAKGQARENACAAVRSGEYGSRELTIRINGIGTQWHDDDLRAACAAGPDAIVVPKVGSADEVRALVAAMEAAGAPDRTSLWAMVETPVAMLHCEEIAGASPRLSALVMGTNDLAKELHAEHVPGRQPLLTGLSLCLLAARATGTVILDLVYAVAPDAKDLARENACAAARSGEYGSRELTIRINGSGTQWHDDDLRAACAAGPDAIVVPKVGSADEVRALVAAMEAAGAPDHTSLWAMVETPVAMLHCEEIAGASPRLTALVMGTNDLAKELHAEHVPGRQPLLTGLSLCLLAARATGTVILDGVYNDVKDAAGFEAECRQGRELGFDGKTLIHPGQVEVCNATFAPSAAAVEDARAVVAAWEAAGSAGVVTHNGRMIENLHVETAERVLAVHEAITRQSADAGA